MKPQNDELIEIEEGTLLTFLKNKFKLLLKDINIIQTLVKDYCQSIPNKTDSKLNIIEFFIFIIKDALKSNKNDNNLNKSDIIYAFICHLALFIKLNDYWILFILPNYFPFISIKNTIDMKQNEFKARSDLNKFLLEEGKHKKKDFSIFLGLDDTIQNIPILKIFYPLNMVICETILTSLLDLDDLKKSNFNDFYHNFGLIANYSDYSLNIDEKTVYYIMNSLIYERVIKPNLMSLEAIDKEILLLYFNFLKKFIEKLKENNDNHNLEKSQDNENNFMLDAIRYQKSKNIFERVSRIFINFKRCLSLQETDNDIFLILNLLFISFEAQ